MGPEDQMHAAACGRGFPYFSNFIYLVSQVVMVSAQSLGLLQNSSWWTGLAVNNCCVTSSSSCCTWIFSDRHNRHFLFPCVLDLSFAGANLYWLQLISLASCLPQGFLCFLIFCRKCVLTGLSEFHNVGGACSDESMQMASPRCPRQCLMVLYSSKGFIVLIQQWQK